ncbi:urease accessory protein UreF [Advenella kashmirensis]
MAHSAALLLLADGRLPAGGYAHSGGLEPTVHIHGLTDVAGLEGFLEGRAATAGLVAASFAAAACRAAQTRQYALLCELDRQLDVRMPSKATRAVSRALGRQLLRAVTNIRSIDVPAHLRRDMHQPVVYGMAAAAFGLEPKEAAQIVLHESVAGPAAAAVKVLSVDPFAVQAALARLTDFLDTLAQQAGEHADTSPDDLPALGTPLLDLAAEHHRNWGVRLFAS